MKNETKKTKRPYRRITAETVAQHKAAQAIAGNGTAAVTLTDPDYTAPKDRAYKIAKKGEEVPASVYLQNSLEQIASDGVQVLSELIYSTDERIQLSATRYAIDHIRGKATQKSVSLTGKLNIQSVLD